jgi:hypothetical protein
MRSIRHGILSDCLVAQKAGRVVAARCRCGRIQGEMSQEQQALPGHWPSLVYGGNAMQSYRLVGGPFDGQRRALPGTLGGLIEIDDRALGGAPEGDAAGHGPGQITRAMYECIQENGYASGAVYYVYRFHAHPDDRDTLPATPPR